MEIAEFKNKMTHGMAPPEPSHIDQNTLQMAHKILPGENQNTIAGSVVVETAKKPATPEAEQKQKDMATRIFDTRRQRLDANKSRSGYVTAGLTIVGLYATILAGEHFIGGDTPTTPPPHEWNNPIDTATPQTFPQPDGTVVSFISPDTTNK